MAGKAIHLAPGGLEDWIVREEGGRELGHYPTKEAALPVAEAVARKRRSELLIHDADGKTRRKSYARGWLRRLFGR